MTITESRKRFNDDGYDRHKIFLYKEDFNKFVKALGEAVTYVKTDLMPDYDFDIFSHEGEEQEGATIHQPRTAEPNTQYPDTHSDTGSANEVAIAGATEEVAETESALSESTVASDVPDLTTEPGNVTADMVAEPMNASEEAEEAAVQIDAAEKLASEEVEKW